MKEDKLTENGVDKLVGGINDVVMQAIAVTKKEKNGQQFYGCELSDGFCKLKGCLIVDEEIFNKNKLIQENLVIIVARFMVQQNREKLPIVIVEHYKIYTDKVNTQIGSPMLYEEFIKKGKKNPKGDNHFELATQPQKKNKEQEKKNKYQDLMDCKDEEEDTASHPLPRQKNPLNSVKQTGNQAILNSKKNLRLSNEEDSRTNNHSRENNTSNSIKPNYSKNNQNSNASRPQSPPRHQNGNRNESKGRPGAIERVEPRQASITRGNQRKSNNEFDRIKDIFVGMENLAILVRVIFVNPPKTFINKRGVESSLQSIEVGDKSGCIECTMFSEVAQKFEGKFKEDQIYEIAGLVVTENTYMGQTTLRLTINEMTRVNLREDDSSVPFIEDFCLSVKQLLNVPVGEQAKVICLVKDSGEIQNMVSKAGKDLRKKILFLCDPEDKVEVEVILWNEKCETTFERMPYMIRGIVVTEYQGNRQYSFRNNFMARPLKHHQLRRYIKDIDAMTFDNPSSNQKKAPSISNLKELNDCMDQIHEKGTWSEIVCCISTIKTTTRPFYLSCPGCKKKVTEAANGQCNNCSKVYEEARPKYIMSICLCDCYDHLWVMAYDEAAEKIVGMSAVEYSQLGEEEVQALVKATRFKEFKLKLVTKNEEYNNEIRKKTSIIRLMELNYGEESKSLLSKLQYLTS